MTRIPLHLQILAAMAVGGAIGLGLNLGASAGAVRPESVAAVGAAGKWCGEVFLTLLNMVVVPLIFSSLVHSVLDVGGGRGLGRLGLRTVAYYLLTSMLAIAVGIALVNLVQPGVGVDYDAMIAAATDGAARPPETPAVAQGGVGAVLADIVNRLIPANVVSVASSNRTILGLIFFALAFAIAAVRAGPTTVDALRPFFKAVFDAMTTLTHGILYVAPVGIGGYLLFVTATTGLDLAGALGRYMLAVFLGLCVHAGLTLPLLLWLVGGRSPVQWAAAMKEALLTAFSTASSAGTLPLTMECARKGGVPERITSFTLPLGATLNMDGTALYEAVAVLFVAQMRGPMSLAEQGVVAITALLASVGAAGIPHAGTVMMVLVMQAVGLPTEAVLVILSVDRVLDMCRTAVNVWSDAVGAAVVARLEGEA